MNVDIYALADNALLKQIGRNLKEEGVKCNISQKLLAERKVSVKKLTMPKLIRYLIV